jgi:hypothetical protein
MDGLCQLYGRPHFSDRGMHDIVVTLPILFDNTFEQSDTFIPTPACVSRKGFPRGHDGAINVFDTTE